MHGVVFDIDGVLYRHSPDGHTTVPGAADVLKAIQAEGWPHMFVSNGTGQTEKHKAETLSALFGITVREEEVILSATPMREFIPEYAERRCLVVASTDEIARTLAAYYGLRRVVTLQQFAKDHPILNPAKRYEVAAEARPLEEEEPIAAVFQLQVPSEWGEGIQIICDVLRSDGILGAKHESETQVVPLFSGNPDLQYGALHSVPRFTNGCFVRCVKLAFEASTKRELQVQFFGKPYASVFAYAQAHLQAQAAGGAPLQRLYMVGDNPNSDIAGANQAGAPWVSVLVRTGCFQGEGNDATHPAAHVCDDVVAALALIRELEGIPAPAATAS